MAPQLSRYGLYRSDSAHYDIYYFPPMLEPGFKLKKTEDFFSYIQIKKLIEGENPSGE